MDYQELDDDQLISLLFAEEDRLPRAAVDEFIRRAERMLAPLAGIVIDEESWTKPLPDWWAPIHATFILGAIRTVETVPPLLKALRHSSKHDCDWVTTQMSSIFRKIGVPVVDGLKEIAGDKESSWHERSLAIGGLAAVTIDNQEIEPDIFGFIGSIFQDGGEDRDIRQTAGNVLLDFQRREFRDHLLAFGIEEREAKKRDFFYPVAFDAQDVERAFGEREKNLWHYTLDWLEFYQDTEIDRRQRRWEREKRARETGEDNRSERIVSSGPRPFVYDKPKVGRNDPCPCGSGKKFKKCCGMGH
jgi:hypothetical protein